MGDLLNAMNPSLGVGVDFSSRMVEIAAAKYPNLAFYHADAEDFTINETFDYIILSDLMGSLWDVQMVLSNIRNLCHNKTRIVISNYNYAWEPILNLAELLHLKQKQPKQNWLSVTDIRNLLILENFKIVTTTKKLLFPKYIPVFNFLVNRILANLPYINHLNLINLIIARSLSRTEQDFSVSIVVPARNECGNIENAIKRTPEFGSSQEFIFVEGHSSDNTYEEMLRVKDAYPQKNISVIRQLGRGKGNAVREGFHHATGEVLMILDADLTMPTEELIKYYNALKQDKAEFVNGCRLVYPMDKQAMRFLNLIANKFFGVFFSYLLGQRLKDTLYGTKVLFKSDYESIMANRLYFGDFDPFGDFDLLFGAARLNLKMSEVIIRYREREYGSTQIQRFRHGRLLIKMSLFAARKIKFL